MARPFEPGENVHVVDLIPHPGLNKPGLEGEPVWVGPSFAVTIRTAEVLPDGESIMAYNGSEVIPIDEKMVFHLDEKDKADAAALELVEQSR
jgi:hypothetical protein